MKYFYINNTKIKYSSTNKSIIDFCENIKINLPHYCYHKNLSISGNCRMCLVELKNSPKPLISCAMPILNKMEIFTNSPLVKKSRENILEFLLLNHPLDCPICDQGGECDLQDQSFVFGNHKKRFYKFKRIVIEKNIGPIVKTVMTRCIHCTRCVRFASEISGIQDLGMFGRGNDSDIGTYVNKVFNSELSGNIIDLCPVGALTSKQYPFYSRNWELKNIKTIDYCDGFGTPIQVCIKNNSIIKIISSNIDSKSWISDKTRFSFDGMFSKNNLSKELIKYDINSNNLKKKTWKNIFKEIINNLYFQDHLTYHLFLSLKLIIIFNNTVNLETLILLLLLEKKYSFITLKKIEYDNNNNDLEENFFLNSAKSSKNSIFLSDLCFLFCINPRYESLSLSLNLRQKYLNENLNIIFLSSLVNLTYPVNFIGTTIKILKQIIEGNSVFCQQLKNSKNPCFIYGSDFLKRVDSNEIIKLLNLLKMNCNMYNIKWNSINRINTSLNEAGVLYLNKFKKLSLNDLKTFTGLYFVDVNFENLYLLKFFELKLLNYFNFENLIKKFLIEQTVFKKFNIKNLKLIQNKFKIYNSLYLPNKNFFENAGMFLNTERQYKKSIKIITTSNNLKTSWKIIRNLFFCLSKLIFISYSTLNTTVYFKYKNLTTINNIVKFIFMPNITYNNINLYNFNKICDFYFNLDKFKIKKQKFLKTKIQLWLDDFYINCKDISSSSSIVMIQCSKSLRINSTNFNYLII